MEGQQTQSLEQNNEILEPKPLLNPMKMVKKMRSRSLNLRNIIKLGDQEEEIQEHELAELVKAGRNANLTQKEAQELKLVLQQLKDNPRKTLADPKLGIDLYKLAEETLLEKIQHDMLTPEQKKLKEYEQRLKEIEEREKAEKEQKEKTISMRSRIC